MIHSKIKIESFAKRCHMGTLGRKGLKQSFFWMLKTFFNTEIKRKSIMSIRLPVAFMKVSLWHNDKLKFVEQY